ncbi:Poly [ADP-ribose] polymerase 6 [Mactra antiquata]
MSELKPPDISRSISCESAASDYTDAVSSFEDDEEDFDGDYLCDVEFIPQSEDSEACMNPYLYNDIENLIFIYGEKAVNYRLFESIDEIDVELQIPLGFLEDVIAEAWKVSKTEPLIVRLHFSLSRYLESSSCPKVEVFQPSKREGFGFGCQVRKFLENFLSSEWNHMYSDYNQIVERADQLKKSQSAPVNLQSAFTHTDVVSSLVSDESVARLIELGYETEAARNALIITHGDVDKAAELLLGNTGFSPVFNGQAGDPDEQAVGNSKSGPIRSLSEMSETDCIFPASVNLFSEEKTTAESKIKKQVSEKGKIPGIRRQYSHPPILNRLRKMLPSLTRTTSMMPGVAKDIDGPRVLEDLNLMPLSTLDGRSAKIVPSLDDGFLVLLFRYVRQRIPTMNEYCVVCDEAHVFQNGAMLKPSVCCRELCVFAFQTLGVMANAADDIATGAEVVDLLINMTRAASHSNRKAVIFDPFPTIVDPKNPSNLLFTPKNRDYNAVQRVMNDIPSMTDMSHMTSSLKQKLDNSNPAVYPMIQWIINSNRSHIVKLPPEKQLDFMFTTHQFLLLSSPPAKEAAFQAAKKIHGSTFAFHGSGIENWHSIIRQGLVNASGTKLQVNGAAYGKGIYLSPHISTSMGYSRMGYGSHNIKKTKHVSDNKPRFLTSSSITCIALCEVICSSALKKNNSIWTHQEPNHVCTRFFFVYEDGQVGDSSINTQENKYLQMIKKACGYKL